MNRETNLLSIIIPAFNEEENIPNLYKTITNVCKNLKIFKSYEIIVVNDGSRDNTLTLLKNISKKDPQFKIISFMRNFGHEAATTAGLFYAKGNAAVIIDADLQDPPELIFEFEKEYINGYEIVYGQRSKRHGETVLKKLTSKLFYPIFRWLTKVDMPKDVGDFCLLSRKAIECFKQLPEKTLFVRGMIYWSGLPHKGIQFIRQERSKGTTKYNYWKLSIFAIDNIISFSTTPIYFIIFLSLATIGVCLLGTIIALIMRLKGWVIMTGWTSLIISMLFLASVTLFFLGLIGLYIGKIFQEVKQRPRYIVDEQVNISIDKENNGNT
jgi:polyisoprenyl-phosphate glycosyltransferase